MHSNDVRGEALYQNWEIHGFLVRSSYDHTTYFFITFYSTNDEAYILCYNVQSMFVKLTV